MIPDLYLLSAKDKSWLSSTRVECQFEARARRFLHLSHSDIGGTETHLANAELEWVSGTHLDCSSWKAKCDVSRTFKNNGEITWTLTRTAEDCVAFSPLLHVCFKWCHVITFPSNAKICFARFKK